MSARTQATIGGLGAVAWLASCLSLDSFDSFPCVTQGGCPSGYLATSVDGECRCQRDGGGGLGGSGTGGSGNAGNAGGAGNAGNTGGSGGAGNAGNTGGTGGVCVPLGSMPDRAGFALWPMPAPGGANAPSYTQNADGTLTDDVTGLLWEQWADGGEYTQAEAASYCQALTIGDCAEWRLPTKLELLSIVDYTRVNPAIDVMAFVGTENDFYWSSTPSAGSPDFAWYVSFAEGNTANGSTSEPHRVRCVR